MSKKSKEIRLDVPGDLHAWVQRKAKAQMLSIADVVRQAILLAKKAEEQE